MTKKEAMQNIKKMMGWTKIKIDNIKRYRDYYYIVKFTHCNKNYELREQASGACFILNNNMKQIGYMD